MSLTVADLMTPAPEAVTPDAAASQVTEIMRRRRVRHVPVIDVQGALVGIISDRDVLRRAHEPGRTRDEDGEGTPLDGLSAQDLMTYVVMSVPPDASAADAGRRMLDGKVSCLPVLDRGHLVGILTESDFVAALSSAVEAEE